MQTSVLSSQSSSVFTAVVVIESVFSASLLAWEHTGAGAGAEPGHNLVRDATAAKKSHESWTLDCEQRSEQTKTRMKIRIIHP